MSNRTARLKPRGAGSTFSRQRARALGAVYGTRSGPMMGGRDLPVLRAVAIVLAAVGLAACSGSDSSVDSTPVAASAATSSSTASTSTTEAPVETSTTEPVPTTSVETTTTVATVPSTAPSTAATVDAESEIRAALAQSFDDFSACLVSMPTCDPTVLEATQGGDLLAGNVGRIEEWNAAGYTVIDRDQFRYVIEAVEVSEAGDRATALVCIADGSKLVEPGAGPDGGDRIVDDVYVSGRDSWQLQLDDDGRWRAFAAPSVAQTEESDICPAA